MAPPYFLQLIAYIAQHSFRDLRCETLNVQARGCRLTQRRLTKPTSRRMLLRPGWCQQQCRLQSHCHSTQPLATRYDAPPWHQLVQCVSAHLQQHLYLSCTEFVTIKGSCCVFRSVSVLYLKRFPLIFCFSGPVSGAPH